MLISYPARPINGGRFGLVSKRPIHLWMWSVKLNGWRALVHRPTGTLFNRHGQELSIRNEFSETLEEMSRAGIEWLDCEALERRHNIGRGSLIVLDFVPRDSERSLSAADRYRRLLAQAEVLGWPVLDIEQRPEENRVYLLKQVALSDASPTGKQALMLRWQQMQAINKQWGADFYEGLVAKRADSIYPVQLRDPKAEYPFWVKHRWAW